MKPILRFFFQGLLVLLPVVLTGYLVWTIAHALNDLLFIMIGQHIERIAGVELPQWLPKHSSPLP